MKKKILLISILFSIIILASCEQEPVYKVGASPVPHAEILEFIKPQVKDLGFEYEVVIFTDYHLPNVALNQGSIIANYFQHEPYLTLQKNEYNYPFVSVGGIHVEPIGLYSKSHQTVDDLPSDIKIIISNSPSDRPRLFDLLNHSGLIHLKTGVSQNDIVNTAVRSLNTLFESEKSISFIEVDPAQLYSNYQRESGDLVLINGNYALDHNLNPLYDALLVEGKESQYVNLLVTQKHSKDDAFIKALIKALHSDKTQEWIKTHYEGAVVPIN